MFVQLYLKQNVFAPDWIAHLLIHEIEANSRQLFHRLKLEEWYWQILHTSMFEVLPLDNLSSILKVSLP